MLNMDERCIDGCGIEDSQMLTVSRCVNSYSLFTAQENNCGGSDMEVAYTLSRASFVVTNWCRPKAGTCCCKVSVLAMVSKASKNDVWLVYGPVKRWCTVDRREVDGGIVACDIFVVRSNSPCQWRRWTAVADSNVIYRIMSYLGMTQHKIWLCTERTLGLSPWKSSFSGRRSFDDGCFCGRGWLYRKDFRAVLGWSIFCMCLSSQVPAYGCGHSPARWPQCLLAKGDFVTWHFMNEKGSWSSMQTWCIAYCPVEIFRSIPACKDSMSPQTGLL